MDWLEELKKMGPLEIPDDAVHSSGYISEEVYRECSERMKQNNPHPLHQELHNLHY